MQFLYYILPFFLLFQSGFIQGQSKRLDHKHIPIIFTDQSRLRATPSLKGKILKELNANETVTYNRSERNRSKEDIINNYIGYWIPVTYKGTDGYIWENTLADFKVELKNTDTRILCKQEEDSVFFSVFKNNTNIYSQGFKKQHDVSYNKIRHYGKTYFSNHADVIAWEYYSNKRMLFLYNGNSIEHYTPKSEVLATRIQSSGKTDSIMLISDHVNLRSAPHIDSGIVANLDVQTPIRYLNKQVIGKINNKHGIWYKVSTPSDSGYIWKDFAIFPKTRIPSLIDSSLTFLQTQNQIVALRHDSVISTYHGHIGSNEMYSKNNMGLLNMEVLSSRLYGESCGAYSGEYFFCWNGSSFFKCGSSGGRGDGPYYEDDYTLFPSEIGDGTQHIHQESIDGEHITISNSDRYYESFDFTTTHSKILKYNGDTLEVVRNYIKDEPKVQAFMQHYFNHTTLPEYMLKIDLNNDNKEDLVCIHNGLHFALANTQGDFQLQSSNKKIYDYIERVNLQAYKDGVAVSIINKQNTEDGYSESILRRLEFVFDKDLNDLVVKRTIEGQYNYTQEPLDIQLFKTKKIRLSEIW